MIVEVKHFCFDGMGMKVLRWSFWGGGPSVGCGDQDEGNVSPPWGRASRDGMLSYWLYWVSVFGCSFFCG